MLNPFLRTVRSISIAIEALLGPTLPTDPLPSLWHSPKIRDFSIFFLYFPMTQRRLIWFNFNFTMQTKLLFENHSRYGIQIFRMKRIWYLEPRIYYALSLALFEFCRQLLEQGADFNEQGVVYGNALHAETDGGDEALLFSQYSRESVLYPSIPGPRDCG